MVTEKFKCLAKQGAEWRLISLLLSRPRTGWKDEIQSLASEILNPTLDHAVCLAIDHATEEEYLKWFGPAGTISPREVAHIGFEDPGLAISDLFHFYDCFHYKPEAEDPYDHIAVETGFVGFLYLKEAYAQMSNIPEEAGITAAARERFLEKHLCRHIRGIQNNMTGAESDYLLIVMDHLLNYVKHLRSEADNKFQNQIDETFECALSPRSSLCDEL